MANQLKPWLPELIATKQSTFVEDRQIQNNIFILHEV